MQGIFAAVLVLVSLMPAAWAAVTVTPADAPAIKQAIAKQKGHVVVVNFWATWCGPCVAEFPALVKLSRDERGRGIKVFAVSADAKRDIASKVKPFLIAQKADFPVFIEQADDPEEFINAFDPAWQGDLPRTMIYNKRGQLVKELSGEQTTQTFTSAVRPFLYSPNE